MTNHPRWIVWSRRAVVAIVGIYTIYVVGANVVLNTGLLGPVISKRPERLLVEWRSGWTVWPGRVHINGLRIRGQSRKIQWQCRLSSGAFKISLLALPSKTVRVSRGRGPGFEFHMRRRSPTPEAAAEIAGIVPEIEGLSNPPDPAPEDIYPPRTKRQRPWFIDVSKVRFDGPVDVWIDELRIQGEGRIGGGVEYRVRSDIGVPEVALDLRNASMTVAGRTLAKELDLFVDASLSPFNPKETTALELLGGFRGEVRLEDGAIADLGVLEPLFPDNGAIRLAAGNGRMDVELSASERGQATGVVDIVVEDAELRGASSKIQGDINIHARLAHGDLVARRFDLEGTSISLERMRLPDSKRDRREEKQEKKEDKAEAEDADWWGRFEVVQGTIELGSPTRLDMDIELAMKDSRPLLKMFLAKPTEDGEKIKVPGWVGMVPNIKNIEGSASFESGPDGTVVDDVVLAGDKFDLLARIRARQGEVVGQLYVHHGILHIGVDMHEKKKVIKLSKPKEWYVWQAEFEESPPTTPPEFAN